MRRGALITRMAFALAALTATLILVADALFDVIPDREGQLREARKAVGEALAVQVAVLLDAGDSGTLGRTLEVIRERNPTLESAGVRRVDGLLVASAGDHEQQWQAPHADRSDVRRVTVPLSAAGERWGRVELAFDADPRGRIARWLVDPLVVTLLFIGSVGLLAFWLYMRRALQHLDPGAVIPERIRSAFDVMTHAVIVLDARGNLLLWNSATERLAGSAASTLAMGRPLSELDWLARELPSDPTEHPWADCIATGRAIAGYGLDITDARGTARRLLVHCAPVLDGGGRARGCLVTLDDQSDPHRANERLRETLVELAVSKAEIHQKSEELRRMAARDPLTGCLNRRAFFDAIEVIRREAGDTGQPFSVMLIDIDHFKSVNDRFGHGVGDRVLAEVARTLVACCRTVDPVCRYGGEEFCIALPEIDAATAARVGQRIRAAVTEQCARTLADIPELKVTVSIGVAGAGGGARDATRLIDAADSALYRAKSGGRDRVELAASPAPEAAAGHEVLV